MGGKFSLQNYMFTIWTKTQNPHFIILKCWYEFIRNNWTEMNFIHGISNIRYFTITGNWITIFMHIYWIDALFEFNLGVLHCWQIFLKYHKTFVYIIHYQRATAYQDECRGIFLRHNHDKRQCSTIFQEQNLLKHHHTKFLQIPCAIFTESSFSVNANSQYKHACLWFNR